MPHPTQMSPADTAVLVIDVQDKLLPLIPNHVAVVRGSLAEPQIAIVDYKGVIKGQAQDIPLQPHDIVYVPFAPYRYLTRYLDIILNTFSSASAINAASAIVTKTPTAGAGVFIPVGSGIQVIPPTSPPPIH